MLGRPVSGGSASSPQSIFEQRLAVDKIEASESFVIPVNRQLVIVGSIEILGSLEIEGTLAIL